MPSSASWAWSIWPRALSAAKATEVPARSGLGRTEVPPFTSSNDPSPALRIPGRTLVGGGGKSEHGELEGVAEVVDGSVEDGIEVATCRDGAVLQGRDGAEVLGGRVECGAQRVGVTHVHGVAAGRDPVGGQRRGELVEVLLGSGDEGDGEALTAETSVPPDRDRRRW